MRAKHINIQIIKHLCITPLRGSSRKHPLHSATSCRYDGRVSDISKSCNHRTCFCRKAPWARPVFRHPRLRPGIPIANRRGITLFLPYRFTFVTLAILAGVSYSGAITLKINELPLITSGVFSHYRFPKPPSDEWLSDSVLQAFQTGKNLDR